ncbi:hypothetical protein B0O99DRAFT_599369 [Bisporella sp. PMI_857]|nr:hypothetical protein B0O99DRAFT_599369 [Bisporella sp. PMI_857]
MHPKNFVRPAQSRISDALNFEIEPLISATIQPPPKMPSAVITSTTSVSRSQKLLSSSPISLLHFLAQSCHVPVASIADAYPPSPLQSSMFAAFLSSSPKHQLYVARIVLHRTISSDPSDTTRSHGLDLERLQRAWEITVHRNEILRTRLAQGPNGKDYLVVLNEGFRYDLIDESVPLEEFSETRDGLEMGYGRPLTRWAVAEGGKWLVWTISHVLYDGWSLPLIISDFVEAWKLSSKTILSHDQRAGLGMSPRPSFKAFIKYLTKERKRNWEEAAHFWRSELLSGNDCVQFPQLKGNSSGYTLRTSAVHTKSVKLSWPSRSPSQSQLPTISSFSPEILKSTYLWAAWAIVLWKHTDSTNVLFGATLNGRNCPVPGIEKISGPTFSTVPVRIGINCEMTVGDFLQCLQRKANSSTAYGWMGLQDILSVCGGDVAKVNSIMVVQPAPSSKSEGPDEISVGGLLRPTGWELDETRGSAIQHNIGICLICEPSDSGLTAHLQYDPNIKSETEIHWIIGQFTAVLEELLCVNTQAMQLRKLRVSGSQEIKQIQSWNSKPIESVNECLHDLFEAQARVRGDAEAIFATDGNITYRQLNEFSRDLAYYLHEKNLGSKSMVPIVFENSRLAVVAILAVLKAGACYVPIHSSTPRERMALILEQIDAKILISSESLCASVKEHRFLGVGILELSDQFLSAVSSRRWLLSSKANIILPKVSPSAPAYTIFTSGSTGTPKGVCMPHCASSTGNTAYSKLLSLKHSSRVLQFASLSFDISCLEIFSTLLSGGCVCIPSPRDRLQHLHSAIKKLRCNVLVLTPTVAKLLQADYLKDPIPIETLVLSGEPMSTSDVEFWAPKTNLLNGYGPTETCFCTFSCTLNRGSSPGNIGYGLGCNTWIVDEAGTGLAPLGTKGELFIEGPIVASGYLNDPKKTRQLFTEGLPWLPDGWDAAGRKLIAYNTGDAARYNPDGSIELFGRRDTQIKIRGMRIDLGEVEKAVSSLGHKAVVLFPPEGPAAGNITAVVAFGNLEAAENNTSTMCTSLLSAGENSERGNVGTIQNHVQILPAPEPDSAIITSILALRHHVSSLIPQYMHPIVWIPTNSLPMLSSAKVSRLAVKDFVIQRLQEDELARWTKILNVTDMENHILQREETVANELAEIVNKLTGTEDGHQISEESKPYHNIVLSRAGIDSIKAIQLARLISGKYKIRPSVGEIVGSDMSIRDLARYIEDLQSYPDGTEHATTQGVNLIEDYSNFSAILQDHFNSKGKLSKVSETISTVFITGATGYLGIEILHQLVEREDISNIIALIRSPSIEKAVNKLVSAAEWMNWSLSPSLLSKIEIWLGDLSEPNLGLSVAHWECLNGNSSCQRIDAIIHVGATVNWTKSYNQLKAVNVCSTLALLNASTHSLLRTGFRPRFLQISGGRNPVSSFASSAWEVEGLQLAKTLSAPGTLGYTQTKFLSDLLVCKWADMHGGWQDASVGILMPGYIIGSGENAVANMDDVLWRLVSTNVGLRMYNSDIEGRWIYLASCASVSRKVFECLLSGPSAGERKTMTIPITNGLAESDFWSLISRSGYPLALTPRNTWLAAVDAAVEVQGINHPLWPVLHFVKQGVGLGGDLPAGDGDIYNDDKIKVELERDILANLTYMRRMGFLPS